MLHIASGREPLRRDFRFPECLFEHVATDHGLAEFRLHMNPLSARNRGFMLTLDSTCITGPLWSAWAPGAPVECKPQVVGQALMLTRYHARKLIARGSVDAEQNLDVV
jgi:hypothetical protein